MNDGGGWLAVIALLPIAGSLFAGGTEAVVGVLSALAWTAPFLIAFVAVWLILGRLAGLGRPGPR